jgi:hypothetical protein
VLAKLALISEQVFTKTGFFMTHQPLQSCANTKKPMVLISIWISVYYNNLNWIYRVTQFMKDVNMESCKLELLE